MIAAGIKKFTYHDYLNTPNDKRYELIEGQLIMMTPAPSLKHQRIAKKILKILDNFVIENDLGEIFFAPCDVVLDNENVVQPDILFISKIRLSIAKEKNIQGSPDLVLEIISEHNAYRDLIKKKKIYAHFDVKEYWIVIPEESSIELYILNNNHYELHKKYQLNDSFSSPLLSSLSFFLSQIF